MSTSKTFTPGESGEGLLETAEAALSRMSKAADDELRHTMKVAKRSAKGMARDLRNQTDLHPVTMISLAAGSGLLVGLLMGVGRRRQSAHRYHNQA